MKVLIAGGSGFLGRAIAADLLGAGHEVGILTRAPALPKGVDSRVKHIQWSNPEAGIDPRLLAGADAIINLAGESLGAGRWTKTRKDRMFASRIETTRHLVAAIAQAEPRPKVMINASAVGYYGPHGDEEVTEAAQPGGDFLSIICSHWEDEAKKVLRSGVRLTILRMGVVLGQGADALARMMMPFRLFVGGPVGSGRQVLSWIHLDDVTGIVRLAVENDGVSGPINATAPNPATNREFSAILGRVMRRPSILPVPGFVLRLILGEMADLVLSGQRVIPKRAIEYGYRFRYPELEPALRSVITSSATNAK
ncbi:MAG: TIGR01777 family oxidoreductase [Candidatus Zixiibacteriota bacterium]